LNRWQPYSHHQQSEILCFFLIENLHSIRHEKIAKVFRKHKRSAAGEPLSETATRLFMKTALLLLFLASTSVTPGANTGSWIRINQLGYSPQSVKVAVYGSKHTEQLTEFEVVDAASGKTVFRNKAGRNYGAYGPFTTTYRLDFTSLKATGKFYIRAGDTRSPEFPVAASVYDGAADFAMRYMRQQRSGYNPFLRDSCHTSDGFTVYGPMADGTHIDVWGGWHDATDYLQYSSTSANATYLLLAAYRDFPAAFSDEHQDNGLPGRNGIPDVLDEATWGLKWLMKMHPREDWMFNQLADDRDHIGFRLPNRDSADYGWGKGKGRPVYFLTGEVQGLGKYKNRATGTSSTAGKFASAFALGAQVFEKRDPTRATIYRNKAISAYKYGLKKPGASQTASVAAPYIYEEDNWVDDMELGAAALYQLTNETVYYQQAHKYGDEEKVTPWMGADTARHYQWYPFHNFGHYELAVKSNKADREKLISFYREGIERVYQKGKDNAFLRGVPFIWCSNNLTTAFAIQCYLYRKLSGDNTYRAMEEACFDWLFGCNPWGTSMVFGLPANGDTPSDPHSSLTVLYKYPLDGGLVDGPVSGAIFRNLIGLKLSEPDEYEEFQSDLAVYHDDHGDYSTNEPTMDGTAYLIYLLAQKQQHSGEVGKPKK
jgi:endoglucanase